MPRRKRPRRRSGTAVATGRIEGLPTRDLPRRLGGLTGTASQATRESRLASFSRMTPDRLLADPAPGSAGPGWGRGLALGLAWILAIPGVSGGAETDAVPATAPVVPESNLAVDPAVTLPSLASLLWNVDATVRVAGGYHDNPRLSALHPAGSSFMSGGGDLVVLRLPADGHEASLFLSIDHRAYLETGFSPETLGAVDLRYTRSWADGWSLGGSVEYLFLSQVFDASELEGVPAVLLAEGHLLTLRPMLGRAFGEGWRWESEVEAGHQWLAAPLDDYLDVGPRTGLVRQYAARGSAGLFYRFRERLFAERTTLDEAGLSTDELLRYSQHDVEFVWRHAWGAGQRWRTVLRPGWVKNLDNGSGYFDYDRVQMVVTVRYVLKQWEARVEGRARWYRYPVQAGDGAGSEDRRRTDLSWSVRGEWKPRTWVRLFVQGEFENVDENLPASDYRANAVSAGTEFEW